jgi:CSLREA domain-containing protein
LSLAVQGGQIYWTQYYFAGDATADGSIGRVGVNGSGLDSSFISGISGIPSGIAVGPQNIYWTLAVNSANPGLEMSDLSGGGITDFASDDSDDPDAITLDRRIVVNSAGDASDANPGDGVCATSGGVCTLRAAIQEANADGFPTPTNITFNIPNVPANTLPTISPAAPLPAATVPVDIDASGQPGAYAAPGGQTIGAIIDGTNAGSTADGLQLDQGSVGSTINGLQIQNFADVGVVVGDSDEQVAGSLFYSDGSGVEVASSFDSIGSGNGLLGDIFFKIGGVQKMVNFIRSNAGNKLSASQATASEVGFGAGVLLDKPSIETQILNDDIGVHGAGFDSGTPDPLPADGFGTVSDATLNLGEVPDISTFGVLVAGNGGDDVSDVNIDNDTISGALFGVLAMSDSSSSVSELTMADDHFGDEPDGTPLAPFGNFVGVAASGTVSSLTIGIPGAGNRFDAEMVAMMLMGVSGPSVEGNTVGQAHSLSSSYWSSDTGLGTYNGIGVMLADVSGAQIGGAGTGQANAMNGAALGVILAGTKLSNDTISHDTFGSSTYVPYTGLAGNNDYYAALGVTDIGLSGGASGAAQNLTITGNSFQNMVGGVLLNNVNGISVTSNKFNGNEISGLIDASNSTIGTPGAGNVFDNSGFGLLLADSNPSAEENQQAGVSSTEGSQTNPYLGEPNEDFALDTVNEDSTANLTTTSLDASTQADGGDTIMGNRFGVDASGNAAPDALPVLLIDPSLAFGGTGAGQGNIVEDNTGAGIVVAGGNSGAQILGNTIYNNENFTSGVTSLAGLGINLVGDSGYAGLGVDAQDPTQPDAGPDNVQNSPVLSSASVSGSTLTVNGSLHGVASTNYVVEVYADEQLNPFAAGEGETLLGRLNLSTDASGNASFSAQFAAPGSTYKYVSSTATTVPASGYGVTSEFSVNAAISNPAAGGSPSGSAGGASGSGGAGGSAGAGNVTPASGSGSTSVTSGGGSTSVTSSSPGTPVTLPLTASCSSATSTPCTVTLTGTVSAAKAKAKATAAAAAHGHAAKPKRVTVASGRQVIAAGGHSKLVIRLTKAGAKLLKARHSLTITLTLKIGGAGRATLTRTLTVRLTLKKKPAKKKKK